MSLKSKISDVIDFTSSLMKKLSHNPKELFMEKVPEAAKSAGGILLLTASFFLMILGAAISILMVFVAIVLAILNYIADAIFGEEAVNAWLNKRGIAFRTQG